MKKSLIDRTLEGLTHTRYPRTVLFLLALLEATISPVIPEGYVAILLLYRKELGYKVLSLISALGSVAGAAIFYLVGATMFAHHGEALLTIFNAKELFAIAESAYKENPFFAQIVAAVTPLPDRVFSLFAGAAGASLIIFLLASFVGRFARVFIIAFLFNRYGDEARDFIKKHSRLATLAFFALVIVYVVHKLGVY